MTQQHHYESIRAKLNKAIPERTELKFGCEFAYKDEDTDTVCKILHRTDFDDVGVKTLTYMDINNPVCVITEDIDIEGSAEIGICKILGTPPTLQEILRVLCDKHMVDIQTIATYTSVISDDILPRLSDEVCLHLFVRGFNSVIEYDLTKPISEQSLETLKSIDELL